MHTTHHRYKSTNHSFASLLKTPTACAASVCPSGAYLVDQGNGNSLYTLGTEIGGPQSTLEHGKTDQWTDTRYAILINDGVYNMPYMFKIGYYMQVSGVSLDISSVVVSPGIDVLNDCEGTSDPSCVSPGGLNNFWRSMSSLKIDASGLGGPLPFAVSQASPVRDIQMTGQNLLMCDVSEYACGYTSGGFIGGASIDGDLILGSQQQFLVTSSNFNTLEAGAWNIVSLNSNGAVSGDGDPSTKNTWDGYPFTILNQKETANLEAPRIVSNAGKWYVYSDNKLISTDNFIVLSPQDDVSPTTVTSNIVNQINIDISTASGLMVMPGIYYLEEFINIPNNKIVLGLGVPSLVCQSSSGKCMTLGSEDVRVTGITFSAGTTSQTSNTDNVLLTVGDQNEGNIQNPDILQDVYCRIARTNEVQDSPSTHTCVVVNSDYTIGENLWLWRADHDNQSSVIPFNINQAQHGLVVHGNNVQMHGLFVEHFNNYQTVWLGTNGQINFYQSEMPYIMPVPQESVICSTPTGITSNKTVCPSLYIANTATNFTGNGLGVYSYFPNELGQETINAKTAIQIESQDAILNHVVTRWLNGDPESGIESIIEDASNNVCPVDSVVNADVLGYALDGFFGSCDISGVA